jgi:hypothetical protein
MALMVGMQRISRFTVFSLMALGFALAAMPLAGARAGQSDPAVFDFSLKGFRAGRLTLSGSIVDGQYEASGTLQSTGILGALRKIRYDAAVTGILNDGRFVPSHYSELADTGKRQSESVMEYRAGVPQVKVYNPPREPRPGDVTPATQGGTVDPLTALYATLRDVPKDEVCQLAVFMFDGLRRSQVVLTAPKPEGDSVTCLGEYRRLAGFTEADMAEMERFPFRLTYGPAGEGMMHVELIETETLFGRGVLRRR